MYYDLDCHKIINSDKTVKEMLAEAYNLGIEKGKRLEAMELAGSMKYTDFNHGIQTMSFPPQEMRIVLTPKLQALIEIIPEKCQHRITVRSVRDNSKDSQVRHEMVLYCSLDIPREDLPGVVHEMIRMELERDYYNNYTHQTKSHMDKAIWT